MFLSRPEVCLKHWVSRSWPRLLQGSKPSKLIHGDTHTHPSGSAGPGGSRWWNQWSSHAWLGTMATRKYGELVDCFESQGIIFFSPFIKHKHGCRINKVKFKLSQYCPAKDTVLLLNLIIVPDLVGWQSCVFWYDPQHVTLPAEASCQVIPQIPVRNQSRAN